MNMLKTILGGLSICGTAAVLTATAARSAPIVLPSGLNVGDQYRLAFVTTAKHNALSTDIEVYNSFVDTIGDTVLASDWKAIASTEDVHAWENTDTADVARGGVDDGVPIYLLDGTRFADDYLALWTAQILAPLNITELGTPTTDTFVWTGTDSGGFATFDALGDAGGFVSGGDPNAANSGWISSIGSFAIVPQPFYAISSVLTAQTSTIPVTAPGSVALFVAGLAGLAVVRRKRIGPR